MACASCSVTAGCAPADAAKLANNDTPNRTPRAARFIGTLPAMQFIQGRTLRSGAHVYYANSAKRTDLRPDGQCQGGDVRCGVAGSTDRRNTFCELLSWGLKEQGLSWPFIELPGNRAELGLAIQGQIDATRKILAQQSVGV